MDPIPSDTPNRCRALGQRSTSSTRLSVYLDDAVDLYRERVAHLPTSIAYHLRVFVDLLLWYAGKPELTFPFATRGGGFLDQHSVPCQDLLPTTALLSIYYHRDKLCYHGLKPTTAQDDRVPFLGLFRKMLCQKYNPQHTEQKLKSMLNNDELAHGLRYWLAITRLGNYRCTTPVTLSDNLTERQQLLLQWSTVSYHESLLPTWVMAVKEYLMFALADNVALFSVLDAHDGSWSQYHKLTLAVCHHLRLGDKAAVDVYLRDCHTLCTTMLVPVSYWEYLAPSYKNQAKYRPDPELVVAIQYAFRHADLIVAAPPLTDEQLELETLPPCHHQKYLLHRRIVRAVLEEKAAETLTQLCHDYFRGKPSMDLSVFNDDLDRDRIYCITLAWYWLRRVHFRDLGATCYMAQAQATLNRVGGYADVVEKAQQFVVCPSCFGQLSMVAPATQAVVTVAKPRGRKVKKPLVSSSVAGLSGVIVDLGRGITYCGRRQGKKTHNCNHAPVVRLNLLGKLLCFNQAYYALCVRPQCGMIFHFDPLKLDCDETGPVCRACRDADKVSASKRQSNKRSRNVDDIVDEDTGEVDIVATIHKRLRLAAKGPLRPRLPSVVEKKPPLKKKPVPKTKPISRRAASQKAVPVKAVPLIASLYKVG